MARNKNIQTVGRLVALAFLSSAMLGPWLYDIHPAPEGACLAPLIWLGNGQCACLISLSTAFWVSAGLGQSLLWVVCLLAAMPFLSTAFITIVRERRSIWAFHLAAWGVTAAFALFLFIGSWASHKSIWLWGAGMGGVCAAAALGAEIIIARLRAERAEPVTIRA